MKVLIVDDDFFFQKGISFFLIDSGHEVLFAMHGQKALEVTEKNPDMDVIICDIDMPVMMGQDFIKAMDKSRFNKMPCVMMVSGMNNARLLLEKNGIQYDYFFEKPLDVNEFAKTFNAIAKQKNKSS